MKRQSGSAAPTGHGSALSFTRGHGSPRPQTPKPRTTAQLKKLEADRRTNESDLADGIGAGSAASITWALQLTGRMLEDGQLSADATYVRLTIARNFSHAAGMLAGIQSGRANLVRARRRVAALGDYAQPRDRRLVEHDAQLRTQFDELEHLARMLTERVAALTTWLEWLERDAAAGLSRAERRHSGQDAARPIWAAARRDWPSAEPVPIACALRGPRSPRAPSIGRECHAA